MKLSVVIPTNTGSSKLGDCLAAIAKQTGIGGGDLEVIVVDNNLTADLAPWIHESWEALGSPFPLHVEKEPVAGIHRARMRGVKRSAGELIIFCDDDNLLRQDFCSHVLKLMEMDPACDLLGSFGIARFPPGFDPPAWFESVAPLYASPGIPPVEVHMCPEIAVCGAGVTIRRKVFQRLDELDFQPYLQGRIGKSFVGGEDVEFCQAARLAGFNIKRDSRLRFDHFMPESRINSDYAKKLACASGIASSHYRCYAYVLEEALRPHAHRAWQHEIHLCWKRFIRSSIRLAFSRPVTAWVDRKQLAYFSSLIQMGRQFNRRVEEIELLARQNRDLEKNQRKSTVKDTAPGG